jgi:hypothetical protein
MGALSSRARRRLTSEATSSSFWQKMTVPQAVTPPAEGPWPLSCCLIEPFAYSVLAEGVGIAEGTTAQPDDEGLDARGTRSKIESSYARPSPAP